MSQGSGPPTRVGREAPKYLLRLPLELRDRLQREANLNNRSVNTEILYRIQTSLDQQERILKKQLKAAEPGTPYTIATDTERTILAIFRKLPPEKQLALISLFK